MRYEVKLSGFFPIFKVVENILKLGSSLRTSYRKKKELSAEGGGGFKTPSSPNFNTGSKKGTSLDYPKKKVEQSPPSGCKSERELYFTCKHGHVTRRAIGCNSRFVRECPSCALKWREKTLKKYSKCISEMENPKLVTLTLKKRGKHRLEELPQLVHRFRFYLSRKGYHVERFVSCLEPPNHVHGVWDCGYIPQQEMSQVWEDITKDSFIVDIRKVDKQRWKKAVYYITKYITKISEIGVGMKGLHIINSWGNGKTKRVRMVCRECGTYFEPLWDYDYTVKKYVYFEYVEVDRG